MGQPPPPRLKNHKRTIVGWWSHLAVSKTIKEWQWSGRPTSLSWKLWKNEAYSRKEWWDGSTTTPSRKPTTGDGEVLNHLTILKTMEEWRRGGRPNSPSQKPWKMTTRWFNHLVISKTNQIRQRMVVWKPWKNDRDSWTTPPSRQSVVYLVRHPSVPSHTRLPLVLTIVWPMSKVGRGQLSVVGGGGGWRAKKF